MAAEGRIHMNFGGFLEITLKSCSLLQRGSHTMHDIVKTCTNRFWVDSRWPVVAGARDMRQNASKCDQIWWNSVVTHGCWPQLEGDFIRISKGFRDYSGFPPSNRVRCHSAVLIIAVEPHLGSRHLTLTSRILRVIASYSAQIPAQWCSWRW